MSISIYGTGGIFIVEKIKKKAVAKKKPRKIIKGSCDYCGKEFETKIKTKTFCGGNCQAKSYSEGVKSDKTVGRPSKYDPSYCQEVIEWMGEGYSFESFAGKVGVCRDTVFEWANVFPDFSDAKNRGSAACQVFWEKMGINGAGGKIQNFNNGCWVFNKKNRFGWKDKQEITIEGDLTPWANLETEDDE